jgi:hypothetical protein
VNSWFPKFRFFKFNSYRYNTADGRFAAALSDGFALVRRVALPQWGDTAHELTIWASREDKNGDGDGAKRGEVNKAEKKKSAGTAPGLCIAACSNCGKGRVTRGGGGADKPPRKGSEETPSSSLRRCRHCREVLYCSAECAAAHRGQHAEVHALRHVPFPTDSRRPHFADDADFKDFTPFA